MTMIPSISHPVVVQQKTIINEAPDKLTEVATPIILLNKEEVERIRVQAQFDVVTKDPSNKFLNASCLMLTSVPTVIFTLTNLTHLFLCNNRLTSIPDAVCGMVGLETLHLHSNDLRSLPAQMGNLIRLTSLTLHRNENLGHIPPSIGEIPGLKFIYIDNTRIPLHRYMDLIKRCHEAAAKLMEVK